MKTETTIKIRGYHIDHLGHVNHARYIEFLEEARWNYMEANNLIDLFHQTGIVHVVSEINVKYKRSAKAGDIIQIRTELEKAGKVKFTMGQSIYLNNKLILEASSTNVFVDVNHQKVVKPDGSLISGWTDLAACLQEDDARNE